QVHGVPRRRREEEMIDARRAESPLELRGAKLRAARDVAARNINEPPLAAFDIDEAHETAIGKVLFSRIGDAEGDDIVAAVEAAQRVLEIEIEKIGDDDHDGALRAHSIEIIHRVREISVAAAALH